MLNLQKSGFKCSNTGEYPETFLGGSKFFPYYFHGFLLIVNSNDT